MKHWIKLTFLSVIALTVFAFYAFDFEGTHVLKAQSYITPTITPVPTPSWSILEKMKESRIMLENTELFIGDTEITHYEQLINRDEKGKINFVKRKVLEEEKEIALALLNTVTGEIKIVKIKKSGEKLVAPDGYDIQIVRRDNGLRWNYWNTQYDVVSPENYIVIDNRYPMAKTITTTKKLKNSKGVYYNAKVNTKTVEYVYYVPYSSDLHRNDIINVGEKYIEDKVHEAFDRLTALGVKSRAFPDRLVTDVFAHAKDYFERIPMIEQSDLGEFTLNPTQTAERVNVIVATNGEQAFSKTCNGSSACGWVQFIPSTYTAIRKAYPLAQLNTDTMAGRANHLNSMMSAILLYDYNLGDLVKKFGNNIVNDPRLEEYLAAAYNGSPRWVHQSIVANKTDSLEWTTHLRKETLGFMSKLRYLRDTYFALNI